MHALLWPFLSFTSAAFAGSSILVRNFGRICWTASISRLSSSSSHTLCGRWVLRYHGTAEGSTHWPTSVPLYLSLPSSLPISTSVLARISKSHCQVSIALVTKRTRSWTAITWVVVWGSSLVMVAWIIIYSFFPSPDFVDEVTVLFGELTFWVTVILSVTIALGKPPVSVRIQALG